MFICKGEKKANSYMVGNNGKENGKVQIDDVQIDDVQIRDI